MGEMLIIYEKEFIWCKSEHSKCEYVKKTVFGGSFCKFKGEAPISLPDDPDFRDPKNL